jgi:hypothetical protein
MPASIFNGTAVKILKKILRFKDSSVEIITGDTDDPSVVAKNAPQGSFYIQDGTADYYQKTDNGSSTNWTKLSTYSDFALLNPEEIYIDAVGGSDTTGTGSVVLPFQTIEHAVTLATNTSSKYVFLLAPGTYTAGPITIPSNISLFGKAASIPNEVTVNFLAGIEASPTYDGLSISNVVMDFSPASQAIVTFRDGDYGITRTDSTTGPFFYNVRNSSINSTDLTGSAAYNDCIFLGSCTVQNDGQLVLSNCIVGINIDLIGTGIVAMTGCTFPGAITGQIDGGNTPIVRSDSSSLGYGGVITVATVVDLDSADYISYAPTTPGDWSVAPVNVKQGLDTLAADKADTSYVDTNFINVTEKAANNGVATLDAGGKVPASQLPNTVMEFKGTWDASTNTPTLADGTGNAGDVYLVSVAGTQNLGSGAITFAVGDWALYSGTIWQKSINSNDVVSVNGQQGVVVLTATDVGAADDALSNITPVADVNFNNQKLVSVQDPTSAQDAATMGYVDANTADRTLGNLTTTNINATLIPQTDVAFSLGTTVKRWSKLFASLVQDSSDATVIDIENRQLKSGATIKLDFSGTNIDVNTRKITNVVDPTSAQDVSTKNYVDTTAITSLTGDVTGTGPGATAATIAANAVTNAKLAQMPTLTIKGNNTGGTANALDLTVAQVTTMLNVAPTVQRFTSGSGTYTPPSSPRAPLYIKVKMIGGGGGGGSSGTGGGNNGTAGTATTFDTYSAGGGAGGNAGTGTGGAGGTNSSVVSGTLSNVAGGSGGGYFAVTGGNAAGGMGGSGIYAGAGGGGQPSVAGYNATTNSGAGGGGAGGTGTANSGPGGGAGGSIEFVVAPSSVSYAIGTGGAGGAAGTAGFAGGAGAAGYIEVTEYYS